jgi:HB1, ASXL, restriction endonuclease HTH domain
MKKAIHEIAADILAENKRAMTAEEIYNVIVERGLYEFKAKSPKSVLRSQLRRHSADARTKDSPVPPTFKISVDGLFSLS